MVLDGGPYDEHVSASHGTYNIRTETGTFYSVLGTAGFRIRKSRYVLTSSNPFAFTGKVVEKHGPDHYLVRQGTVTTCELPHPKWQFYARHITVDVDGSAKIYNSNFRISGIPVFYFPFVTHPVQKQQRQSGFLIPSLGNSSTKGKIAGESVYWAINRSMDVTVGGEYYSKRGWAQHGEFRARPSDTSFIDFNYVGVVDRGIGIPRSEQDRIFQRFYRGDKARGQTLSSGAGLGLPIARKIIDSLGGHIDVETQIGVGSTFPAELTAVPSLIFWTVTGIVIGLFADTRKEVLWWGALYGFFLSFSFLFSRFGGTTAQIPRYLALVATASIVSAVCGIVVVYVGWTIHRLFSRSQPTS